MNVLKEEILILYSQAYPIMADCVNSIDDVIENRNYTNEKKVTCIIELLQTMREKYTHYCQKNYLFGLRKTYDE